MSSVHIPIDLIQQILLELPVKSLCRFKSVSRLWQSLISSPEFLQLYTNKPAKPIFTYFSRFHSKNIFLVFYGEPKKYVELADIPTEPYILLQCIGSCNGIICFFDHCHSGAELKLWNPSMNECLDINVRKGLSSRLERYFFGFGYDPERDDHVLAILDSHVPMTGILYYLKTKSWEDMKYITEGTRLPRSILGVDWHSQVLPNREGRFHWLAYCHEKRGNEFRRVLWFDVRHKALGQIELPKSLKVMKGCKYDRVEFTQFGDFNGLITLFAYFGKERFRCCHVWVMESYGLVGSWKKLECTIRVGGSGFQVIGFLNNSTVLVGVKYGMIVSYNLETREVKDFGIGNSFAGFYQESLYSLKDK